MKTSPSSLFVFGDGKKGSSNPTTVGADAFLAVEATLYYLYVTHGRVGLDDHNGPQLRAVVNFGTSADSQWSVKNDGILLGAGDSTHYDMASLDVVAHELGHGLSAFGPKLIFGPNVESGHLAEANADMFAMLVSASRASVDPVPYWIGESTVRATSPPTALRYMEDPAKTGYPACYYPQIGSLISNHAGAGPADHMFYLLVYGGASRCNGDVVPSIGYAAAEKIWYNAFYNLPGTATYRDLRAAFVAAAMSLQNGPTNVVATTVAAFDAVNIPQ